MTNKKVLIVTYYWPPSGGSGVQRWLKFVKYLDRAGWETLVLTPENPAFGVQDASLVGDIPTNTEVIKLPIWEPYSLFLKLAKFFGKERTAPADLVDMGRSSAFRRWSAWIRGNLFIPDARIFWVRPAVSFLTGLLTDNKIETIITTGPPHSIHLIGLRLKKKMPGINWVADFRDPWSEWDVLESFSPSPVAKARHRKLEKRVLQSASRVMTIAPYHAQRFEAIGGRHVDLVTNGFDEEDFAGIEKVRTEKFTVRHVGNVDELRDPRSVMEALARLCRRSMKAREKVMVEFIGNVNTSFRRFIEQDPLLREITNLRGAVPHDALLKIYGETDLQLLVLAHTPLAPGNLPGKFFEYLASGNRILAVGPPDGDAAAILHSTGAGKIFDRGDAGGMERALEDYFEEWSSGNVSQRSEVSAFSRKNLTAKLIQLLEPL